jgi:hypothetical protein
MVKYLFIEGTKDNSNGDLRQGFRKLFEKKVKGSMPRISMGEGKDQTIKKFINAPNAKILCDLDAPPAEIENDLKKHKIIGHRESVFYMIQEMEAWFISQPKILDEFYNSPISKRLVQKHGSDFNEPDKELQNITKDTLKGTYHKVRHGVLLEMLDANKLSNDFSDFRRLIEQLSKLNNSTYQPFN